MTDMFAPCRIVEYRVRKVDRFIITRYTHETTPTGGSSGGCETLGEFDNALKAEVIAQALAKSDEGSEYKRSDSAPIPSNGFKEHPLPTDNR